MSNWSANSVISKELGTNVTAILGEKDLGKLELNRLIGSLTTQEMLNSNEDEKKKKRNDLLRIYPFQ